ncbi:KamA family radical SAM protein [Photorhabdus namnaonensis]|uniref:L-lysine 2,3-aminomutase n=1 Tax=Photorhabdus namnaonensis TaxID=1851568 RepID=A0A1B8YHX4_9GAMM|nr:KamA family radical SAM protein [Photorhabdus namnaonensis]OCA54744.1 L-lysine 2,3-aminomutase [Photorhabdus namnaonensis]
MSNETEFWKSLKCYRGIDRETFLSEKWQVKNTIKNREDLVFFLRQELPQEVIDDFTLSLSKNPMQIKISPYVLSLINWNKFHDDPIRKQFIPLFSEYKKDHPALRLDSLNECDDSPVQGIIHRYPNKVLFLSNHSCPVYCRFCTRSYMVGESTASITKHRNVAMPKNWHDAIDYIMMNKNIEDVVVSGGDAYTLPAKHLKMLLTELLNIQSIKRLRIATKSLSVLPTKFLADDDWTSAIIDANNLALKKRKQFSIQTHFNHANEITWITKRAADFLFDHGIKIRNQTVLMKDINDSFDKLKNLMDSLVNINIEPYYIYMHDLVPGSEFFRTTLKSALELEELLRGSTSGYNIPNFVVDLPGGGGKRNIWSYRHYDTKSGISIFRSPVIDKNKFYFYFDPIVQNEEKTIDVEAFSQANLDIIVEKIKHKKIEELR